MQVGALSIQDLANLIEGSEVLSVDSIETLLQHNNAVFLFMGAGDIQKFQRAFEQLLNEKTA